MTPTNQTNLDQVVVGVDSIAGGYNPHLLANQTLVSNALSQLVLPSVFRTDPSGAPQLDRTLMVSAEVTNDDPFTVSYTVRNDASWSDGAPIAVEDFSYLWQNMRSQPGVVDPAGYRLITSISSRDGGRTADVVFSRPYPGWRSLFQGLLPAHLLKDAPGGWAAALVDNYPTAGGPFAIKSVDKERGEIILQRNDRYWSASSKIQRIVLRQAGQSDIVSALRTGDDQLAVFQPTGATMNQLSALGPQLQTTVLPWSDLVELLLRPSSPRMSDPTLRAVVAAALDREALTTLGTLSGPSNKLLANAYTFAPSQPGYQSTMPTNGPPAKPDLAQVDQLLIKAGYVKTAGVWLKDNRPLTLNIAAPSDREPYATIAKGVQQQLASVGIGTKMVTATADQLFEQLLAGPSAANGTEPDNAVDIAVVPQSISGDPATNLASEFGCRTTLADTTLPAANPAGFCNKDLQPIIDAALTGAMPLTDALGTLEPKLWAQNVVIPLFQLTSVVAVGSTISGVDPGPALVGPFPSAKEWARDAKH